MTEKQYDYAKRFTFAFGDGFEDMGNPIPPNDACDLLNEQDKTIKQLQEEIKDFQDLLAGKEEELLKPIIRMIDDRIAHYKHKPISAPISNPVNPKYDADVDRLARLSELEDLKETLKELSE